MNKHTFARRYAGLEQKQIDRMWHSHEMEQEQLMKMQHMFEQAKAAQTAAAVASGAGGGGFISFNTFDIFVGKIFSLNPSGNGETYQQVGNEIFPGFTVFAPASDENMVYFVTHDSGEGKMIFGKIDYSGGNLSIIDEVNLTGIQVVDPSSLFYEGGGSFVLLTQFIDSSGDGPKIIRITKEGVCTLLSSFDTEFFYPTSLFKYNDQWLSCCSYTGYFGAIGPVDINTGSLIEEPIPLYITGTPYANTKVWLVTGLSIVGNTIFANTIYADKDAFNIYIGISTLDIVTGECRFMYPVDNSSGAYITIYHL